MSDQNNKILLVCGLPRCGSSLLLNLLNSLGIPLAPGTRGPLNEIPGVPPYTDNLMIRSRGRALKVLDPHEWSLPVNEMYDVILLIRDPVQQSRSIKKTAIRMKELQGIERSRIKIVQDYTPEQCKADTDRALTAVKALSRRVLVTRFEDVINYSNQFVEALILWLNNFGWSPDKERKQQARDRIVSRSSDVFDGMLEERVIV